MYQRQANAVRLVNIQLPAAEINIEGRTIRSASGARKVCKPCASIGTGEHGSKLTLGESADAPFSVEPLDVVKGHGYA